MKKITSILSCALIGAAININAATVTVDPLTLVNGFMNVYDTGGAGYGAAGAGGFVFPSGWAPVDLRSSFSGSTLTLQANTIGDPNNFWYVPTGGPGGVGNKIMEANLYAESTGVYVGTSLTFTGTVMANNLLGPVDAAGHGWTSVAIIKDFASDYSSFVSSSVPLTALGAFSVSLNTINDPARHVQYGFQTIGPDVWAGDPLSIPSVIVAPIPEPTTLALAGLGGMAALAFLRRRK